MSFELVLLYNFLLIFGIQFVFFIVAYLFKTDKFTDLVYGLSFVIVAFLNYIYFSYDNLSSLILLICVLLWGLRLGIYLFIRIIKIGKDNRFDNIRDDFISLVKFWIGQTVAILFVSSGFIVHMFYAGSNDLYTLFFVGIIIFLLGLLIETISDYQKFILKNKFPNKWVDKGLFSLIRHPNYLGEILVWIGIWISILPYDKGIWGIVSPLFIIVLLLFVSGIPPLESQWDKKYSSNPNWEKYKNKTNKIIPYVY